MKNKLIIKSLSIFLIAIVTIFIFFNFFKQEKEVKIEALESEEKTYNSNVIKDVNYTSTDVKGNSYKIYAKIGEVDINNSAIIYLTDVTANIKLKNSEIIKIVSDFGKYNINNYDTIFSKNVNIVRFSTLMFIFPLVYVIFLCICPFFIEISNISRKLLFFF